MTTWVRISPITDAINSKLRAFEYIQLTFKRLRNIKTLNYTQAKVINEMLDANGLGMVTDEQKGEIIE